MSERILVTYASKYGATKAIADAIGATIQDAGLQVDVLPAERVEDVRLYQAVILGSAVYVGKWMKSACEFLQAQEAALVERPVWIFSSGPTGDGDPIALLEGWRLPPDQQPVIDRIRPRGVAVFHGNIDAHRVNWIEKTAVQALKKPFGDFRDWTAIRAWAASIMESLKGAGLPIAG